MNDPQTNRKAFLKRAGLGLAGVVAVFTGARSARQNSSSNTAVKGVQIRTAKHAVQRNKAL